MILSPLYVLIIYHRRVGAIILYGVRCMQFNGVRVVHTVRFAYECRNVVIIYSCTCRRCYYLRINLFTRTIRCDGGGLNILYYNNDVLVRNKQYDR